MRPYKIPGGKAGMWRLAGIAFITSLFVILFGFIPTQAVRASGLSSMTAYVAFLLIGVVIVVAVSIFCYHMAEKSRTAA